MKNNPMEEHRRTMAGILDIFDLIDNPLAPKLIMGGILVEPTDSITQRFCEPVQDFLRYCDQNRIRYDLWEHSESNGKLDIGYTLPEVAITLAYAKSSSQTYFFVFVRKDNEQITKPPKDIVKKLVGTIRKEVLINGKPKIIDKVIDVMDAAKQAEKNLEGIMSAGAVGPFPVERNDKVYIDLNTYEERHASFVNFATGSPNHSFNIVLDDLLRALNHLYGDRVQIVDLFEKKVI